jgi:hypothetical protein
MRRGVALLLIASCAVEHKVVVSGAELHRVLPEIRAHGSAVVAATDLRTDGNGHPYARQETVRLDMEIGAEDGQMSFAELVKGCHGAQPEVGCDLDSFAHMDFELYRYNTHSARAFFGRAGGIIGLTAFVGAVGCGLACADGSTAKTVSEYTVIGLGAALVGVIVWAIVDCMGKWGQPGCRD